MTVTSKMTYVFDVTPCSLMARYKCFGGTFSLHFLKVEKSLTALKLSTIVLICTLPDVMSYNIQFSEFIKKSYSFVWV
jgi:hypothetical protein